MATLRDIRNKIGGVKKTQQITKAMNMVAAAKLRGAQMRMENFRPYASKFLEVINNLSSRIDPESFPLMAQRPVKKVELISLTADRGLCGSFNVNLINQAEKFWKAARSAPPLRRRHVRPCDPDGRGAAPQARPGYWQIGRAHV
jgi:F-type H+-transporting ATPase subunit gamma